MDVFFKGYEVAKTRYLKAPPFWKTPRQLVREHRSIKALRQETGPGTLPVAETDDFGVEVDALEGFYGVADVLDDAPHVGGFGFAQVDDEVCVL